MRTILRIEILLVASYIPGRRVRAEGEVLQWMTLLPRSTATAFSVRLG
jgi:hypothetical protein